MTDESGEKPAVDVQGNTDVAEGEKPAEGQVADSEQSLLGAAGEKPVGEGEKAEGAEAGGEKPAGEEKSSAPEKYEAFAMPEGVTMPEEVLIKFSELAKGADLSQDAAQKLVDLSIGESQRAAEAQAQAWKETREGWVDSVKQDKEFGGVKFPETVERAIRAVKRFGGDGLVEFLNSSGLGDNAELVKAFARVDQAVSEDKLVDGKPGTEEKTLAEKLYPNLK